MQGINKQKGFTIIELLIATTIFSFVLLIATTGIIRIGNLYYKGITVAKTQDAIRNISDELTRSVQFAGGFKTNATMGTASERFCLGDTRYTVYLDKTYKSETPNSGLIAERMNGGSCESPIITETKQLLATNMRVLNLQVIDVLGSTSNAWHANIRIAYGDNDLLTHYTNAGALIGASTAERDTNRNTANCKSGIAGGSFCAVAQLDTVVKKRLN